MEDSLDPLGADPSELKMAELRAELQARGLDPKGNRPMLVERLRAAQEEESAGDLSDNGNWLDLKLEEGPIWIKEEALDMKEEPLETEESEMTARRGEKRSLSHSCPPEAAQGAKMQRLEVKNEPQYCETVVSTDWRPMQTFNFYGKKPPPTPKGVKGFVIREEPQSDSEVSDISAEDSEDEYLPSKDDDEVLRHDLMIDCEDEDRVVMGRSRRRTLLPELSAKSAEPGTSSEVLPGPSSEVLPGPSRMTVTLSTALPDSVISNITLDLDDTSSGVAIGTDVTSGCNRIKAQVSTKVTRPTLPVDQQRGEVEEEEMEEEEEEVEEQTYKNLKSLITWTVCNPEENNERPIPDWLGCLPNEGRVLEPIDYLRMFFDNDLLSLICTESNRYALQGDSSKPLKLTVEELEVFLGLCIYMSVVKVNHSRRYWCPEANIKAVSDFMSRNRWERIKSCIHFADNTEMPERDSPQYDKLYKVRPYLDHLKEKFNKIPVSKNVCVDEMMVPYKGSRGPRYYIKGKPNPWGFKVWTLADSFGIVHNFEVCTGATQKVDGFPDLKSSANIVCKLASVIPSNKNCRLFMDNLFSTIPLFCEMFNRGILCMGTVRSNRLAGLKLISDKDLKSKGKSSFVEYEGKISTCAGAVRVVRWNDNNICTVMSTLGSAQPVTTIERWNKSVSTTQKAEVGCPALIKHYNANMGGVDKMDSLVAFYRMFFRSKKWYHRLFFHFFDVAIANAWLLYRRDLAAFGGTSKPLILHDFKLVLSQCLRLQNKPLVGKKRGRPSATVHERQAEKKQRGHNTKAIPSKSVRHDQVGHFPINLKKRGRCKMPGCKSSPVTWCLKCQLYLCIGRENSCFLEFHGVQTPPHENSE